MTYKATKRIWHAAGPHNQACIGYGGKDAKPHTDPAIQAKADRFAVLMEGGP